MTYSPEEVAAFADGELEGERQAEVAAAVAADPELAEQVRAHRALRERLSSHFAPIMEAPLPERLLRPLQPRDTVVNLSDVRWKRHSRSYARWAWLAGPALAASLVLALLMQQDHSNPIEGNLALALDRQLVAEQAPGAPQRILLSFRNTSGEYCRAFTSPALSGIACREADGWRLEQKASGAKPDESDYRMAGSSAAELLAGAQAMAVGPALDAGEERRARENGWR
jgi:hypothetical protein